MSKSIKYLLFMVIVSLSFVGIVNPVKAEESGTTLVEFQNFSFETDDFADKNVVVDHVQTGLVEVATITDVDTGEVLDTIEIIPNLFRAANTYTHTIVRSRNIGKTTVQLSVHVTLYSNGSFRQFNAVHSHYLGITNSVTSTSIEGSGVSVTSPNGFPTTQLNYQVSGTLVGVTTYSMSSSASAQFFGIGVSSSYSLGGYYYHRIPFQFSGQIYAYHGG